MKIARLAGMAPDDDHWAEIVAESSERVETAWDNIEGT